MTNVLNMLFNLVFTKPMKKSHPENVYRYKKIEDGLHFDGLNFPANNNDIENLKK